MSPRPAALSYSEPDALTILVLASFILLLNIINWILDRIVYCGLIGQILVGVAYGVPGTNWLSGATQDCVMQLGYLGLILIVYEGGLSTNLKTLRANLFLSASVAAIGITAPIALSFVLQRLLDIQPLQAFAAGAALCSTSLGTTFTVLSTSGLTQSRLGVVLTSAAMMDDVVGLIMVQVITTLGQTTSFDAATILRPIGVSFAFATVLPLVCVYVIKPLAAKHWSRLQCSQKRPARWLQTKHAAFVTQTLFLAAMVIGSSYAGTSNLFAAYLAGACVVWWEGLSFNAPPPCQTTKSSPDSTVPDASTETEPKSSETMTSEGATPHRPAVYDHYFAPAVNTILKPFFFASIGFSIPITKLFAGDIVWRGLVYAILMILGKLLCGVCLLRINLPLSLTTTFSTRLAAGWARLSRCWKRNTSETRHKSKTKAMPPKPSTRSGSTQQPRSLHPAAILGSAMVARGEIGFLISAVAESNGVFGSGGLTAGHDGAKQSGSSELFLVVTWAILACTVLGPVTVGLLVRRVRRLQEGERRQRTGRPDPLGIWGVVDISG